MGGEIMHLLMEAYSITSLVLINTFVHLNVMYKLIDSNLTVLKLVNITPMCDYSLEYFLKKHNKLKTFHFCVMQRPHKDRQVQESTTRIIYKHIHKQTNLVGFKLNAFGGKAKYENLLKLQNLLVCGFVVNRYEPKLQTLENCTTNRTKRRLRTRLFG